MEYLVIVSVILAVASGRVANSPTQHTLNELLANADPLANEIFFEPKLPKDNRQQEAPVFEPRANIHPAFHLVQTLSKPEYIDASEFRNNQKDVQVEPEEILPPFIDINRHLTLMKASHRFAPPEVKTPKVEEEEEVIEVPAAILERFLPRAAALFREDFPQDQTILEPSAKSEASESEDPTTEAPVVEEKVIQEADFPKMAFSQREPSAHALSPLSHILAGFRSEFGSFGGDRSTDSFVSGFRPDDF